MPSIDVDALSKNYLIGEDSKIQELLSVLNWSKSNHDNSNALARDLVEGLRGQSQKSQLIDTFLQEYGLSTEEGIILMRLAESLIRTPDKTSAFSLIRDKIEPGNWSSHIGESPSAIVDIATLGLGLTKGWIRATGGKRAKNLAAKLGDHALYLAIFRVMQMMGDHYVLGKNIDDAIKTSLKQAGPQDGYSFDMLGEAAHTYEDAERYFAAYRSALIAISKKQGSRGFKSGQAGLSVKLSAIHPRYEFTQRDKCVPALLSKLEELACLAKEQNINITIDAEEAERLELSLIVLEKLSALETLKDWGGLGFVVQAYQRRALPVLRHLIESYKSKPHPLNIRLVKGAYWDTEIKRAQEMGLESYPVFTRKENTDLSYLACAKTLLGAKGTIFPRFATHNAHTAATIITLAGDNKAYEFQRLHGMGKDLHDALKSVSGVSSRVYAPVGRHEDLLPYLVRRLLENGANSSFVNQLSSDETSIEEIIADPIHTVTTNKAAAHPNIHAPRDHFSGTRLAAKGVDFAQAKEEARLQKLYDSYKDIQAKSLIGGKPAKISLGTTPVASPANTNLQVGAWEATDISAIDKAISIAKSSKWAADFTPNERSKIINNIGHLLERDYDKFLTICVQEAGKTWPDAIAEVREAIDFCHYYAEKIEDRDPLGVVACISPWNFPLAIFLGQVVGALAAGNTVICKPAAQTPLIAYEAIKLLFEAGVPKTAVHLVLGDGAKLGNHLSAHKDIDGICFTGSTATALKIAGQLVKTQRAHIPLIAETGGLNAMVVDSTALLEQVTADVIASAFQSAGQRCSACRIVCVQEDIADDFIEMLAGAMKELNLAAPHHLSADVGPVIDGEAHEMLKTYIDTSKAKYKTIYEVPQNDHTTNGHFIGPIAFEIPDVKCLEKETFGPVLHIVRFKENALNALINDINGLGYGLTMGLHTRIDDRITLFSNRARVGNLYVNRNQIGAVVGVQPFGGEGLSGTGPKAGGPRYLRRLSKPKGTAKHINKPYNTISVKTSNDIGLSFDAMRRASNRWIKALSDNKLNQIIKAFEDKFDMVCSTSLSDIYKQQIFETPLPGPTGESNSLSLHPRGVILVDVNADTDLACTHVLKALATGNAALIYNTNSETASIWQNFAKAVCDITGETELVKTTHDIPFTPDNILDLGGVITTPERINAWADWALSMGKQLVPILTTEDETERFFIERTLTVNTTAAGGNATLLAL